MIKHKLQINCNISIIPTCIQWPILTFYNKRYVNKSLSKLKLNIFPLLPLLHHNLGTVPQFIICVLHTLHYTSQPNLYLSNRTHSSFHVRRTSIPLWVARTKLTVWWTCWKRPSRRCPASKINSINTIWS